jgi:cobalt-precorrin-5B (C1)-methyltransferase
MAGVIKDAGDDPDVTHGAEIVVTVATAPPGAGLSFRAGDGVGRVTLPGLPLAVGEPAINPGPRAQIAEAMASFGVALDCVVTISVPGGQSLAARTMNGRLGIIGGLSILGTTGIVRPYSCAAWVHAIHRGIDVARAIGLDHLAGCTGKTSEAVVARLHNLSPQAMVDMGDFVGAVLKYLRRHPVARLTLGGGPAKLTKLAAGHMDLHSGKSVADLKLLLALLESRGAPRGVIETAGRARSVGQLLAAAEGWPLGPALAEAARATAIAILPAEIRVDVVVVDRQQGILGRAG